jgi:RHS repeat-associated protein
MNFKNFTNNDSENKDYPTRNAVFFRKNMCFILSVVILLLSNLLIFGKPEQTPVRKSKLQTVTKSEKYNSKKVTGNLVTTDGITLSGSSNPEARLFNINGDIDSINPFEGNVSFSVPLYTMEGRGNVRESISLPILQEWSDVSYQYEGAPQYFYPAYNLQLGGYYYQLSSYVFNPGRIEFKDAGWRYEAPYERFQNLSYYYFYFVTSNGQSFTFYDQLKEGKPYVTYSDCNPCNPDFRGNVWFSKEGGATFILEGISGANTNISGRVILGDGTVYKITNDIVVWKRDANGNKVSYEYNNNRKLISITDSLNRKITFEYDVQEDGFGTSDIITYKGINGSERKIRISKSPLANSLGQGETIKTLNQLFPGWDGQGTLNTNFNPVVTSKIWMPDGRKYEFLYNSYGEIARVNLPSGGAYEYSYETRTITLQGYNRRITEKRTLDKQNNLQGKIKISPPTENVIYSPPTPNTTSVTIGYCKNVTCLPGNGLAKRKKIYYHGIAKGQPDDSSFYYSSWVGGKIFKTEDYTSDGQTLLQTEEFAWQVRRQVNSTIYTQYGNVTAGFGVDSRISQIKTTLNDVTPNLVKSEVFTYDDNHPFNNISDIYTYNYGEGQPGTLLKRTHTDYVTDSEYVSYTGAHIRKLPKTKWVSSDEAGNNKLSYTEFEYDNYIPDSIHAQLLNRNNITGHDPLFDIDYKFRGNLTTLTSYATLINNGGTTTKSNPITIAAQFDIAGNTVKAIDAKGVEGTGNAVTFSFEDAFGTPDSEARSNSAPTELGGLSTYAFKTRATNSLGFVSYTQYDYFTGKIVNAEGINGNVTAQFFTGALDRISQSIANINFPQHKKQTTTLYDDNANKITITSDLKSFNDNLLKMESYSDGLGRATEIRSYDNGSYSVRKTEYDLLGRPYKISNPYNPLLNEPLYWTTNRFDSLGRLIEVETPDGAKQLTEYDGNKKTVIDQSGRKRSGISDALGNVVQVIEDPNTNGQTNKLNYTTSYTFDALGNIRKITQDNQSRYYSYDALSRMIRIKQPEQDASPLLNLPSADSLTGYNDWSMSFKYDRNGNIVETKNSRNITVTGAYDVLNRLIARGYSDGTPDTTYTYEDSTLTSLKNILTKTSSSVAVTRFTAFDEIGRVKSSQQQILDQHNNWQIYNFPDYTYDLSGNLISQTYPSGRIVTNTFNNDNRLIKVAGTRLNQNEKVYADNFRYTSFGAVDQIKLGNGKWESTEFDEYRLFVKKMGLGSSASNQSLLKLEYDYGNALTSNNSLQEQKISFAPIGASTGFSAKQTYTYDSLNRLSSSVETSVGSETQNWQQNFAYDRFGNRTTANTVIPGVTPLPAKITSPAIDSSNNRFVEQQDDGIIDYDYDENGNLIVDAMGRRFTYDAENRQKSFGINNSADNGGLYVYDGQGKRIKKLIPNGSQFLETIFLYDAFGKLVAEMENTPPPSNGITKYITADVLNTPRIITNQLGEVVSRHDYMGYGEELTVGTGGRNNNQQYATNNIRQKFTSYERDNESGLDYAQARYYSSQQARFTSVDPLISSAKITNPQTFNRYSYALNSPYKFTDPLGLYPCRKSGATAAWVGADPDGHDVVNCEKLAEVEVNIEDEVNTFSASDFLYLQKDGHYYITSTTTNTCYLLFSCNTVTGTTSIPGSVLSGVNAAQEAADLANLYYNAMLKIKPLEDNPVEEVELASRASTERSAGVEIGSEGGVPKATIKAEAKSGSENSASNKLVTAASLRRELGTAVDTKRTKIYDGLMKTQEGQAGVNNSPGNNMASYIANDMDKTAKKAAADKYYAVTGKDAPNVTVTRPRTAQ